MEKRAVTEADITPFIEAAQVVINEHTATNFPGLKPDTLEVTYGRKYAKIASVCRGSHSAWAFIDLTNGDILKPASWAKPAKHARGNILAEDHGVSAVGPYGPHYLR